MQRLQEAEANPIDDLLASAHRESGQRQIAALSHSRQGRMSMMSSLQASRDSNTLGDGGGGGFGSSGGAVTLPGADAHVPRRRAPAPDYGRSVAV